MRFGLWYAHRNPLQWRTTYAEMYAEIFEQIRWAETIGYDDVWLTEHHFCEDGHSPSPLVLASAIAGMTKKIRIGTGVLLIPLYDPVRLAEDVATIDVISNGRFQLGVGVGYRLEDFSGLGINRKHRGARANEALEIVRRLLDGETLSWNSKYFEFDDAKVTPEPVQKKLPLWVGGFSQAAVKRAARLGDGYLSTADPSVTYPMYLDELKAAGKSVDQARVAGGHFWLIVSNDPEKTFAEVAPHILYQMNMYAEWLEKAGEPVFPYFADVAALKASGILQVLTPDDAVKAIKAFTKDVPLESYYTWTIPPGYPVAKMNEHLELFAKKVMPAFR